MTKVPERPLSYGEIQEKARKLTKAKDSPPSRAFAEVEHTSTGYIKKYKMHDKHLIAEQIANQNHIASIRHET